MNWHAFLIAYALVTIPGGLLILAELAMRAVGRHRR